MSRRGGRNSSRGGRGNSGRGGHGCGRGQNYTGTANTSKRGLCATLGNNLFDYGQKSAGDQMRASWENLVQYVGTNYGQDNSNKLQNKVTGDSCRTRAHGRSPNKTRHTRTDDQNWSDKYPTGTKSPVGHPANGS